jgi:predicted  nucleic acid-binding Zn-ribbon protein
MPEVTHEQLKTALEEQLGAIRIMLDLQRQDVNEQFTTQREVLDAHSLILDAIARHTEHWRVEAAALKSALDRHESYIQQMAKKLGLKFG